MLWLLNKYLLLEMILSLSEEKTYYYHAGPTDLYRILIWDFFLMYWCIVICSHSHLLRHFRAEKKWGHIVSLLRLYANKNTLNEIFLGEPLFTNGIIVNLRISKGEFIPIKSSWVSMIRSCFSPQTALVWLFYNYITSDSSEKVMHEIVP